MIRVIDENGNDLHSVDDIAKYLNTSASTTRRLLLRLNCEPELEYKNRFYYSENSLFVAMKMKLKNELKK
jgi:hypothetical protein